MGTQCIAGNVSRLEPAAGEEDDPCLSCHLARLGTCIDGCGTETTDLPGCSVAAACGTWSRVAPGASCASDVDCEPGEVDGTPSNTLICQAGTCVDVGSGRWSPAPAIEACSGDPWFGPHPACHGAACLGSSDYSDRVCSAARCIDDSDCPPAGWHCRCQEESSDQGFRAWRWCVPNAASADAGG